MSDPPRSELVRAIQRRAAEATPFIPVWLVAPQAWAQPQISTPRFDGSGRLLLGELRPETDGRSEPTANK